MGRVGWGDPTPVGTFSRQWSPWLSSLLSLVDGSTRVHPSCETGDLRLSSEGREGETPRETQKCRYIPGPDVPTRTDSLVHPTPTPPAVWGFVSLRFRRLPFLLQSGRRRCRKLRHPTRRGKEKFRTSLFENYELSGRMRRTDRGGGRWRVCRRK